MKRAAVMNSPNGCPSVETMASIISEKGGQNAIDEEGVFTPRACAHRIRYGCLWMWVAELSDFVRNKLTARDHFFPAFIPPAQVNDEVRIRAFRRCFTFLNFFIDMIKC